MDRRAWGATVHGVTKESVKAQVWPQHEKNTCSSSNTSIHAHPWGFYTQTCFLSASGGGVNVSTVVMA